jgi:two-component system phosphate regulon sensor histidine kinase PhoR
MKKVFPIIVVLISLSVLGIIFIQMSWIRSAISLRKQQHEQDIAFALSQIKDGMYDRYATKLRMNFSDEASRLYYMKDFSSEFLTKEEINLIVSQSIRRANIKEPYEYMITDIFRNPLSQSANFNNDYFSTSFTTMLTTDNSMFRETLYIHFQENNAYIIRRMGWIITASIIFTIIIISAFALTVRTLFTQRKLSEIKSDFINNMTHELKTPLATISLAIDALTMEKVIHDTEKIRYYSAMIKGENKRMNKQVEKILQAARIEKQELELKLQELNVHEVIRKVADGIQLQIQEKQGSLTLNLTAPRHIIMADEVHFSNIIFNLLDNAMKYSKDNLQVEVSTASQSGVLAIKVRDNGIGMNKETQGRVFEKFYRAHTGNIHNVKGFGLGLSYVKGIVEAHGGKVKVESKEGRGSTFTVFVPLAKESTQTVA